jgi:hypothetical protein
MKRVCVFCGSSKGARPEYEIAARAMGQALVKRGIGLVYGGGYVGLMGVIADTVMKAGGEAIGVIPKALFEKEVGHRGITELRIVGSMHERKALMADLSDAFVAMPGGYGTFEEFCEVLTWAQLGFHRKPCGLLNVGNYYAPLLTLFDQAVSERFVKIEHRSLILKETDPERMLDILESYTPPMLDKWIDREQT